MQGSAQEKKKKMYFNPKNAQDFKISKKLSPNTCDTVNGLSQHNFPDLWDKVLYDYVCVYTYIYIGTVYMKQKTSLLSLYWVGAHRVAVMVNLRQF